MRVALVCPYAWDRFGGVQSHVRSLAAALRARDHDVLVIAPTTRIVAEEPGVWFAGRAIRVPANGSVAPVSFGPMAAAGVRRALNEFRPEVAHLHEPLIPSVSLLALWNARSPVVGTFHAAAESSAAYRVSRPVLGRAARKLTIRTAVSEAAKALAAAYFPGDFLITPNGVDVGRFRDAEPLDLGGGKKLLFFSRIERRKGLEVLIDAMAALRDLDVELVVAGSGPQERSARALAERRGIAARFLGSIGEDDVPRLYRSATVYCAPGLGGESFGIVLLEAMAAGTPVVCSDLPGFREVAAGAGALVPANDPAALARELRAVLTDDARRAEMATKSVERADWFDWERLSREVERVYEHAMIQA